MVLRIGTRGKAEVLRSLSNIHSELSRTCARCNGLLVVGSVVGIGQSDLISVMTDYGADFRAAKRIARKLCGRSEALAVLCGVLGQQRQSRRQQLLHRVSATLDDAAAILDEDYGEELHELFLDRSVAAVEELVAIGLTEPICVGMAQCLNSYYHEVAKALELRLSG